MFQKFAQSRPNFKKKFGISRRKKIFFAYHFEKYYQLRT